MVNYEITEALFPGGIAVSDPTFPGGAGGSSTGDYYVHSDGKIILDMSFSFNSLHLGISPSAVKSAGVLVCRAGFAMDSYNSDAEGADITLWGQGEIKDDSTTPTNRDQPIIIRDKSTAPNPVIMLRESGAAWSVKYYVLIRPLPLFQLYEDINPDPEGYNNIPFGNRVDVTQFSEDEGGARFKLQDRAGKKPRYFRQGDEGRSVVLTLVFDTESGTEVGLWQQFLELVKADSKGCLITRRRVWPNVKVTNVGPITEQMGRQFSQGSPSLRFVESA